MQKVLVLNTTDGRAHQSSVDILDTTDTSATAAAGKIPIADGSGLIDADYIPVVDGKIALEEADGSPSTTGITKIIVGNGDLSYLGGGIARLKTAADASGGGGGSALTVKEADGTPSVTSVVEIQVGNGDLVDLGSGVVRIKTAADAAGGGSGGDSPGGMLYLWATYH